MTIVLAGCAAQMVEKDANDSCAKVGKKASFLTHDKEGFRS